jgi:hypothetical protein
MRNAFEQSVSQLCLAFPQGRRVHLPRDAHYRVHKGKVFAMYAVNHPGDGRIALWLNTPEGNAGHVCPRAAEALFRATVCRAEWLAGIAGVAWTITEDYLPATERARWPGADIRTARMASQIRAATHATACNVPTSCHEMPARHQ